MGNANSIDAEIEQLRDRLNELASRQSEEINRLRSALTDLERKRMEPAEPPPIPQVEEPELVPVPVAARPDLEKHEALPENEEPEMSEEAEPTTSEAAKPEPRGSFELQFGRVWLVRVGVVLLVTGLVLLGNYAYRNWIRELPAMVRLAFLFAGSFGLIGAGWRFTLNDGMRRFGEVLLAGGLAFFYWCAFAAHHVDRLRVVDSPVVASLMLLASAGLIVAVSLKRDARTTAVMGLLLASYSTVLQPLGWLSAGSNVMLSVAGVLLMRRPGWMGAGVAGMAGTYLAFLWMQLAGGSGGPVSHIALFFLPASWAVFALPGIAGLPGDFGRSLSERGRAWFTGVNNGAFLALYSWLWLMLDYGEYWRVPAVFGLVIVALGSITRARQFSGSTHVGQGLAMLTLALVLKLEGYQLALGLAMEGLMLSGAFLRFRRPTEMFFSILAQAGAMWVVINHWQSPVWSSGVAALLVAAAGVVVRIGSDRIDGPGELRKTSRLAATCGLGAATVMGGFWCLRLDPQWGGMVALALALGFTGLAVKCDRKVWLPELRWMNLGFAVLGGGLLVVAFDEQESWNLLASLLISGTAAVIWEREHEADPRVVGSKWTLAGATAWLYGLITVWSLMGSMQALHWPDQYQVLASAILAPGLAFIAMRVLHCPRLRTSLSLSMFMPLCLGALGLNDRFWPLHFLVPVAALAMLFGARGGPVISRTADKIFGFVTRSVALLGWVFAWMISLPDQCIEVLALSGGALMVWQSRVRNLRLPEAWILLVGTGIGFLDILEEGGWRLNTSAELPDGWGVVVAFIVATLCRPQMKFGERFISVALRWVSALMVTLWTTLAFVQVMGWNPVVILWSLLGFALVCSGLWLRLAEWRYAGFVLLGVALVKLFAVDVWDFAAFTRVLAFIALGVALVALGFFYNRFAEILKRLLEGETAKE